jgi:ZIP family zinc transporter
MWQSAARAALGTAFPFLMTVLGAAAVFFFSGSAGLRLQKPMFGFAAGVMTAASVWSLLLPAIEQAAASPLPAWLPAAAGLVLGAVTMAGLDAALGRLRLWKREGAAHRNALLMTAITLHNVPEGMAVGLAFALAGNGEGLAAAGALALGIGIQNLPEGAAVALPRAENGRGRAFAAGALSGAVEPLFGVLTVLAAAGVRALLPWLLSFAAGAMLYVTAAELIPQAQSRGGTWGFVAGFVLMMVLDVALGA